MSPTEIATIIATVLQSTGLAIFLFFIFRALRREIASLRRIIDDQSKTLDVMERRILETEKVGSIYRHLIQELPEDLEKYKKLIASLKNEMIHELELANQKKDQELAQTARKGLSEIENQERIISELPQLREELLTTFRSIEERIARIAERPMLFPSTSSFDDDQIFERWADYMEERGLVLKKRKKKDACFITSACVEARGRNDDCVELTAIRWWRDGYVKRLPYGEAIIKDYYDVAPKIVSAIDLNSNMHSIYEELYQNLVLHTVELISKGRKEEAFENYWDIVCNLKNNYLLPDL